MWPRADPGSPDQPTPPARNMLSSTRRAFLTTCAAARLRGADSGAVIRISPRKGLTNTGSWGGAFRTSADVAVYEDSRIAALDSFSAAVAFNPSRMSTSATLLARPNQ
jgi:hypothetical protein